MEKGKGFIHANRLFWSLNGKLTEEGVRDRIKDFQEKGFGGFFLHARAGLRTEYFSEEWFSMLAVAVDEAEKRGMEAWLYDEDGWPSGFGGGRINRKGVDYCQKYLVAEGEIPGSLRGVPVGGVAEDRLLVGFCEGEPENIPSGDRYRSFRFVGFRRCAVSAASFRFGFRVNPYYVDIFNPAVSDAFLSEIYGEYERRFGKQFGKTIKGVFTDEPQYGENCFSRCLCDRFHEKFGYDPLDFIFLLYAEGEAGEVFRQDYYTAVCEAYRENFAEKINLWCRERGLLFTGHFPEEDGVSTQYFKGGNIMLNYTAMDFPGIDFLGRRLTSPVLLKQISSAKNQLGVREVLSESFGCCGWNASFADYLRIWGYQSVNGVNNACLHLSAYSVAGVRKRDYPSFFSGQNNWWDCMSYLNRTMKAMNDFSSCGKSENDVLVLSPVFGCASGVAHGDDANRISTQFRNLIENLISVQIPFDIAEETYLCSVGAKLRNGEIIVGECRYRLLVVPSSENVRKETADLIVGAAEEGVTVVFCEKIPSRSDGLSDGRLAALAEKRSKRLNVVQNRRDLWRKYFDYVGYERKAAVYSSAENLISDGLTVRTTFDGRDRRVGVFNGSTDKEGKEILALSGVGNLFLFDPKTGEEKIVRTETDGKMTFYSFRIGDRSLLTFRFREGERETVPLPAARRTEILQAEKSFLTQDNLLVLDRAELRMDGKSFGEDYVLNVQRKAYEYGLTAEKPFPIVVKYRFVSRGVTAGLRLGVETETCERVSVNGKTVVFGEDRFIDECIRTASLEGLVREGENEIEVYYRGEPEKTAFHPDRVFETEKNRFSYRREIESVYLLGRFDVGWTGAVERTPWFIRLREGEFYVETPTPKNFGEDLTGQGLWFYRGDAVKEYSFVYGEGEVGLSVNGFDGALCTLRVNGRDAGWFAGKEEVDVTRFLHPGRNGITLTVKGTNRNALGPHHHVEGEQRFVGVNTFRGTRGYEDEILFIDPPRNTFTPDYSFVRFGIGDLVVHREK